MSDHLEELRSKLKSDPAYSSLLEKVSSMISGSASAPPASSLSSLLSPPPPLDPSTVYLRCSIGAGAAFTTHLSSSGSAPSRLSSLHVSLAFAGCRRSTPPTPACMAPQFAGEFTLPLCPLPPSAQAWGDLLSGAAARPASAAEPSPPPRLHLLVLSTPTASAADHASYARTKRELVASGSLDWRSALACPDGAFVELSACGAAGGFLAAGAAGSIKVRLSLVQRSEDLTLPVGADEIAGYVARDEQRTAENARDFYLYAKDWWRAFQELSPLHATRPGVRIFASDETGTNRSACTYVRPASAGRLVDSPRHAARFVSLLPFERRSGVGGRRVEQWQSWHALLARGRGDVEDHANLLCSLLRGFGMDSYVCLGEARGDPDDLSSGGGGGRREHAWVVTVGDGEVTFTESLTGQRYELGRGGQVGAEVPYASVACVYSDVAFYANKADDDSVEKASWNFKDVRAWKSMDPEAIKVAPPTVECEPTLTAGSGGGPSPEDQALALEEELRGMIRGARED
ncbi:hypothetical protein TeGR_g13034, partial [Tetraparma gracilis]